MKRVLSTLVGVLPSSKGKNFLLSRLGHSVSLTASIGPVLIVGNTVIVAGDHARVGPLNVFRHVNRVSLGSYSEIGQLNWISAAPFLVEESSSQHAGEFHLGEHSSFTSRHYVDASGGVIIDKFVTVAGVRSVFMTHGIDVADSVLDTFPITIGEYAMVGGGCNLVMGADVPSHSVVAMGSVVIKGLRESDALFAGAPATFKKAIPRGAYATRSIGAVPPRRRADQKAIRTS